jgi:hypothetical protein
MAMCSVVQACIPGADAGYCSQHRGMEAVIFLAMAFANLRYCVELALLQGKHLCTQSGPSIKGQRSASEMLADTFHECHTPTGIEYSL